MVAYASKTSKWQSSFRFCPAPLCSGNSMAPVVGVSFLETCQLVFGVEWFGPGNKNRNGWWICSTSSCYTFSYWIGTSFWSSIPQIWARTALIGPFRLCLMGRSWPEYGLSRSKFYLRSCKFPSPDNFPRRTFGGNTTSVSWRFQ